MLIILKTNSIYAQKTVNLDTIENTIYLGKFKLKTPAFFSSKYKYDPQTDTYIYSLKLGDIDVGAPQILTPAQYIKKRRDEDIKSYFLSLIHI